jgi:hypothetical protein
MVSNGYHRLPSVTRADRTVTAGLPKRMPSRGKKGPGTGPYPHNTPLPCRKPVLSVRTSVLPSDFALLTRTKAVQNPYCDPYCFNHRWTQMGTEITSKSETLTIPEVTIRVRLDEFVFCKFTIREEFVRNILLDICRFSPWYLRRTLLATYRNAGISKS